MKGTWSSVLSLCLLKSLCLFTELISVSALGPGQMHKKGHPRAHLHPRAALGWAQGEGAGAEMWIGAGSALGIREIPLNQISDPTSSQRASLGTNRDDFGCFQSGRSRGAGQGSGRGVWGGFPVWSSGIPLTGVCRGAGLPCRGGGRWVPLTAGAPGFIAVLRCCRSPSLPKCSWVRSFYSLFV